MDDRYLFKAKRIDWRELPKEKWWVKGYLFDDGITSSHRMFVGGLVIEPCKGIYYNEELVITGTDYYEIDKETICRPTGLKDRHGKLIWENDIVKFKRSDDKEFVGEISYVEHYGAFFVIHSGCSDNQLYAFGDYEVIGNIFDNPELLESEE